MDIPEKVLFKTVIGSDMWSMRKPDSDYDIMDVYQQPTHEILSGYSAKTGKSQKKYVEDNIEYDIQYMEIGHLVNLLIKGNVNAIWTVTSPVVLQDSVVLRQLREITVNNLSKRSYASIYGMAMSQQSDHTKRPNMPANKAYKTCLRTLNFGVALFESGEIRFNPVNREVSVADLNFKKLEDAYTHTKLPDEPDEKQFRNFLYELRIAEL